VETIVYIYYYYACFQGIKMEAVAYGISRHMVFQRLNYMSEKNLVSEESHGGSLFGGYPSLEERDKSYNIKIW
jgi:hypothetical protein